MAQQQWTYLSHDGSRFELGIYHGAESGHVLIYSGEQIISIDFSVNESKDYHFYLGEELCKLELIKDENSEEVEFKLSRDDEVLSPVNQEIKNTKQLYWRYSYFLIATVVLLMIILILSLGV